MKDIIKDHPVVYDKIIVDAMNLIARSHYGIKLSYNGVSTGMIYGVSRFILNISKLYPKADIIFVWEGFNSIRKERYTDYKANRRSFTDGEAKEFKTLLEDVKRIIPALGVSGISHVGLEADDVAGWLAHSFEKTNRKVLLVSTDADWFQFVLNDNFYVMKGSTVYSRSDLEKDLGYDPCKIWVYKILKGDSSDGICGLKQFPKKTAIELSKSCNTLKEVFNSIPHKKYKTKKFAELLKKNWDLIKYHPNLVNQDSLITVVPKKNIDIVNLIFSKYGIKNLEVK